MYYLKLFKKGNGANIYVTNFEYNENFKSEEVKYAKQMSKWLETIKHKIKRGDLIMLTSKSKKKYLKSQRNDWNMDLYFYTGANVIIPYDKNNLDEYGYIPNEFNVIDEFYPGYWDGLIEHNNYVYANLKKLKKKIIKNANELAYYQYKSNLILTRFQSYFIHRNIKYGVDLIIAKPIKSNKSFINIINNAKVYNYLSVLPYYYKGKDKKLFIIGPEKKELYKEYYKYYIDNKIKPKNMLNYGGNMMTNCKRIILKKNVPFKNIRLP